MATARELIEAAQPIADALMEQRLAEDVAARYAAFDVVLRDRTGDGAPAIVSGYRSPAKQRELLQRWEAGDPGIVAKPARFSWHMEGRAIDVDTSHPNFEAFRQMWEDSGGRWGGRFSNPDAVHFDVPGSVSPEPAYA